MEAGGDKMIKVEPSTGQAVKVKMEKPNGPSGPSGPTGPSGPSGPSSPTVVATTTRIPQKRAVTIDITGDDDLRTVKREPTIKQEPRADSVPSIKKERLNMPPPPSPLPRPRSVSRPHIQRPRTIARPRSVSRSVSATPGPPAGRLRKPYLRWTAEEERRLVDAVDVQGMSFAQIAASILPDREPGYCSQKYGQLKRKMAVEMEWGADEDAALVNARRRHARAWREYWEAVANELPWERSKEECEQRYECMLKEPYDA